LHTLPALLADLEWKVVYVGSAAGPQYDQELENVLVGPVPIGTSKFVLTAPPPDPSKIPEDDLLGATVALICCSYKGAEFIRVGYWINNTYGEALAEGAVSLRSMECGLACSVPNGNRLGRHQEDGRFFLVHE
jgi:hypothetical protein